LLIIYFSRPNEQRLNLTQNVVDVVVNMVFFFVVVFDSPLIICTFVNKKKSPTETSSLKGA